MEKKGAKKCRGIGGRRKKQQGERKGKGSERGGIKRNEGWDSKCKGNVIIPLLLVTHACGNELFDC